MPGKIKVCIGTTDYRSRATSAPQQSVSLADAAHMGGDKEAQVEVVKDGQRTGPGGSVSGPWTAGTYLAAKWLNRCLPPPHKSQQNSGSSNAVVCLKYEGSSVLSLREPIRGGLRLETREICSWL